MAAPKRLPSLHRPQIYVHVEFGVSWSQRRAPNQHGVTYRSRGLRERLPNFPRQVPPLNTNYLAGTANTDTERSRQQSLRPEDYALYLPPRPQDLDAIEEERRSSRDSRSSHERGRSAPPPINNSPWDITNLPESSAMGASSSSRAAPTGSGPQPMIWKDLPEVPSRFRLGEDGMPWSAWSWPDADPDDARLFPPASRQQQNEEFMPYRRSPAAAYSSPEDKETAVEPRGADPSGKARELEALGHAMMTIDNGFENQWWNSGGREPTTWVAHETSTAPTPAPSHQPPAPRHQGTTDSIGSLGWAVASTPLDNRASYGSAQHLVSPLSRSGTLVETPPPRYIQLTRSMSTRSEELFLDGGRWG
jgi:hypothetical protein